MRAARRGDPAAAARPVLTTRISTARGQTHDTIAAKEAQMLTILIVAGYLSFSPVLGATIPPGVTECAEVLRLATSGNKGGKITHVHAVTALERVSTALVVESTVRPVVAYTIQGPGSEVGIVICGTVRPVTDPEPAPTD
jgi:hypothetical protein